MVCTEEKDQSRSKINCLVDAKARYHFKCKSFLWRIEVVELRVVWVLTPLVLSLSLSFSILTVTEENGSAHFTS